MTLVVRLEDRRVLRTSRTVFSPTIVTGLAVLADALAVLVPGFGFYVGYVGWSAASYPLYTTALVLQVALTLALFSLAGLYGFAAIAKASRSFGKVIGLCGVVFLLLVTLGFALKATEQFSRVWAFAGLISIAPIICATRAAFGTALRRWARAGQLCRNIVIIGAGEQSRRLLERLSRADEPWHRVIGIFDDRLSRVPATVYGCPVLGRVDDLVAFARNNPVDDVIIALPWQAEQRVRGIARKLRELPVDLRLGSDLVGFSFQGDRLNSLSGVPVLDMARRPTAGWRQVVKVAQDKILAGLLLVLLAPVLSIVAIAIRLESPGPVLYRQRRYGFNNQPFTVLKFRTMLDRIEVGTPQAQRFDPRVTRVGRLLRRTSLDELPQLFNVLGGSMSLVGPRPHAVAHNEAFSEIIDGYSARHRVRPGITGWAQVNGLRGETNTPAKMRARVEHDIYYIENWSLLFDLRILLLTAFCGFLHENAY